VTAATSDAPHITACWSPAVDRAMRKGAAKGGANGLQLVQHEHPSPTPDS
jgi:hypothetical protein